MRDAQFEAIVSARARNPGAFEAAASARDVPASPRNEFGKTMILAIDHPARGALRAGGRAFAMGDRRDLLDRICCALARPGVNGVLGTPDILDDLLLLGALDRKLVIGTMNRGGLAGTTFELDDRFTAYDAESIVKMRFQGGKMLMRIDPGDDASVRTVESCGHAVSALSRRRLIAMVEPFLSRREDGVVTNDLTADAMVRAATIAAGLGVSSAYTWLKVPIVPDMERVMAATTLPALILGGEVQADVDAVYASWRRALALPTVQGLVVGRQLLYPPGDDVAAAVDIAVGLLREAQTVA